MRHLLLATFIVLFTSGCKNAERATSDINEPSAPIVGVLDTTGYQITLHTGAEATRYTIHNPDGKILAEEITAGEFAQRFPKIHHEVQGHWAENFIRDPWRSQESRLKNSRRSHESLLDDPGIRPRVILTPPPKLEGRLIELPPLPDLRTEDEITPRERRIREATNQPGK